jgi:hypothetical protein
MSTLPVFLSLGAGVQSSTLAFMAACGEVAPMPTAAIFADTQAEPKSVYKWLEFLIKELPFPVIVETRGDLSKDNSLIRTATASGKVCIDSLIPAFLVTQNSSNVATTILQRRCTGRYKIDVVQKAIRKLLGKQQIPTDSEALCEQWIGISLDEAHRMKPSRVSWIRNAWPLIDRRATRRDCFAWMKEHKLPKPPRSACVFCPYHSDAEWKRLQDEEPEEFRKAVLFERRFQRAAAKTDTMHGKPFLHRSFVLLDQVTFHPKLMPKVDLFGNECEGMCGV